MPYIVQEKRNVLDPVIRDLLTALRNLELDDQDKNNTEGNINYVVSVVLDQLYTSNYGAMNDAMGFAERANPLFATEICSTIALAAPF